MSSWRMVKTIVHKKYYIHCLPVSQNQYLRLPTDLALSHHKISSALFTFIGLWQLARYFDTIAWHNIENVINGNRELYTFVLYRVVMESHASVKFTTDSIPYSVSFWVCETIFVAFYHKGIRSMTFIFSNHAWLMTWNESNKRLQLVSLVFFSIHYIIFTLFW